VKSYLQFVLFVTLSSHLPSITCSDNMDTVHRLWPTFQILGPPLYLGNGWS